MDYNKLITEAQDNNIGDMYDTFSHILADKVVNGIDARRATIASSLLEDCGCEACHAKGAKSKKKRKLEELTVKSMDKKASLDVYKRLKKGDKVAVEFGSAMSATGTKPIELVVTSPHRVVGKSKVGRIILKNPKNMRGMKYTLYNRNGVVSLAQGDMGTILKDLKIMNESVQLDECWDTHVQRGYKMKGGKRVPNCVPKNKVKESTIPQLQKSNASKMPVDININGNIIHVTPDISESLINLHDELNEENQEKMRVMLEDSSSFVKLARFAQER